MIGAIYKSGRDPSHFHATTILTCIWLMGLLLGIVLAFTGIDHWTVLPPVVSQLSFASPQKYLFVFLPFLLSGVFAYFSQPGWLYWLCGIKASWFSICCYVLCRYYGQAGWLACELFMFSDICSLPFLFFYWLRCLSGAKGRSFRDYFIFLPIVAIAIIDYRIISPYAIKFGFF